MALKPGFAVLLLLFTLFCGANAAEAGTISVPAQARGPFLHERLQALLEYCSTEVDCLLTEPHRHWVKKLLLPALPEFAWETAAGAHERVPQRGRRPVWEIQLFAAAIALYTQAVPFEEAEDEELRGQRDIYTRDFIKQLVQVFDQYIARPEVAVDTEANEPPVVSLWHLGSTNKHQTAELLLESPAGIHVLPSARWLPGYKCSYHRRGGVSEGWHILETESFRRPATGRASISVLAVEHCYDRNLNGPVWLSLDLSWQSADSDTAGAAELPLTVAAKKTDCRISTGGRCSAAGLGEAYFRFALSRFRSFAVICMVSENNCQLTPAEKVWLGEIFDHLTPQQVQRQQLHFLSERENPGFFRLDGAVRIAKTGSTPGDPIYVNTDIIAHEDAFNFMVPITTLVHEFGHQVLDPDPGHDRLDRLGVKVAIEAGRLIETHRLQADGMTYGKLYVVNYRSRRITQREDIDCEGLTGADYSDCRERRLGLYRMNRRFYADFLVQDANQLHNVSHYVRPQLCWWNIPYLKSLTITNTHFHSSEWSSSRMESFKTRDFAFKTEPLIRCGQGYYGIAMERKDNVSLRLRFFHRDELDLPRRRFWEPEFPLAVPSLILPETGWQRR